MRVFKKLSYFIRTNLKVQLITGVLLGALFTALIGGFCYSVSKYYEVSKNEDKVEENVTISYSNLLRE